MLYDTSAVHFMPKITYIRAGKKQTHDNDGEKTMLETALEHDIDMQHACGGFGLCTTCMVAVKSGQELLQPMTEQEVAMGLDPNSNEYRLGCQCKVKGDVIIELPY